MLKHPLTTKRRKICGLWLALGGLLGLAALLLQRDIATGEFGRRQRARATPSPVTQAMQRLRQRLPPEAMAGLDTLRTTAIITPNDDLALLRLGEQLKAYKELEAARLLLQRAAHLNPSHDHTLYMLAEIYRAQGLITKARRTLYRLLKQHPENSSARLFLAEIQREAGHIRRAARTYRTLLASDPANVSALNWSISLCSQLGYHAPTSELAHRFVSSHPGHAETAALLAHLAETDTDRTVRKLLVRLPYALIPIAIWGLMAALARILARRNQRPGHTTPVIEALGMYTLSLSVLLAAHLLKITADPALNGEELDFAFRNLAYLRTGIQPDQYSTTFSSVLLYGLGNRILPATIHYGRLFRIVFLAALPLTAASLARRLAAPKARRLAGWVTAILCLTMTPVIWLGIMSIDYCIDTVFSLCALGLAERIQWHGPRKGIILRLTGLVLLVAWTVHIYAASLSIFPVLGVLLIIRLWRHTRNTALLPSDGQAGGITSRRDGFTPRQAWSLLSGSIAVALVLIQWPRLLYHSRPLFMFAGGRHPTLDPGAVLANLQVVSSDLFHRPQSYLLLDQIQTAAFPWNLTGLGVCTLAAFGWWSARQRNQGLVLVTLACAALSLLTAIVVEDNPGLRRCVSFAVILCAAAGAGAAAMVTHPRRRTCRVAATVLPVGLSVLWLQKTLCIGLPTWWQVTAACSISAIVLAGLICIPQYFPPPRITAHLAVICLLATAITVYGGAQIRIYRHYTPWLQKQFTFRPGCNYEQTVAWLVQRMSQEQLSFTSEAYDPNTFFMLSLLAERRKVPYIPPVYQGPWDPRIPFEPYIAPESQVVSPW